MSDQAEYSHDVFISHAEADSAWVQGYLLPALGLPEERAITRYDFRPGAPLVAEFERAVTASRYVLLVLSPAYLADEWSSLGEHLASYLAIDQQQERLIPVHYQPCDVPLRIGFRVSLDCTTETNCEGEMARLRALLDQPEPVLTEIRCPYPGMVPFRANDARHFFGREVEIDGMLQHLRHQRFLLVVGDSGAGKSSLIHAGLLPRLHESTFFPPGHWLVRTMRPGSQPLQTLSEILGADPVATEPDQAVVALLIAHPPAQCLLLIIDQFEELFTQSSRPRQSQFIAILRALRTVESCTLVLVLRGDFFYTDLTSSDLWPVAPSERLEIAPLRGAALRDAIVRPAAREGVYLEPTLIERLLLDAADERGVLPLVQETMVQLWSKMDRRLIRLRAYEQLGGGERSGLAGALVAKADATLTALAHRSSHHETIARRIFVRLVQFGEGRPDTRRQQPDSALRSWDDDPQVFDQTLQHLAENRLLTLSGEEDRNRNVDIAHEALFTEWPALREHVREWRQPEQIRRRLEGWAADWTGRQRDPKALLNALELSQANEWLDHPAAGQLGYSKALTELVEASRAALDKEAARRASVMRFRLSALAAIVALIILALGIGLWASQRIARQQREATSKQATLAAEAQAGREEAIQANVTVQAYAELEALARTKAEAQTQLALSRLLVAEASSELDGDLFLALLLGVQASQFADTLDARGVLLSALLRSSNLNSLLLSHRGEILELGLDPEGSPIAFTRCDVRPLGYYDTACPEGQLRVWDLDDGQPVELPIDGYLGALSSWALSPDGRTVALANCEQYRGGGDHWYCAKGGIRLWDLDSVTPVGEVFPETTGWALTMRFSPDGQILALSLCLEGGEHGQCNEQQTWVWDVAQKTQPIALAHFEGEREYGVSDVALSPDNKILASVSWDSVMLRDIETGRFTEITRSTEFPLSMVTTIAFSSWGHILAVADSEGCIFAFDVVEGRPEGGRMSCPGQGDEITSLAFAPHDDVLAVGIADGTIDVIRVEPDGYSLAHELRLRGHSTAVSKLVFGKGGRTLISGSLDGRALLWNVVSRDALGELLVSHKGGIPLALSPSGRLLASTNYYRTEITLWDTQKREQIGHVLEPKDKVMSLAFSPSDRTLALGDQGGALSLWDVESQSPLGPPLVGHVDGVSSLAFSPVGDTLASGDQGGAIILWDVASRKRIRTLATGDLSAAGILAFSPKGPMLAAADPRGHIVLWNTVAGHPFDQPPMEHGSAVTSLAFVSGGEVLASGSAGVGHVMRSDPSFGVVSQWGVSTRLPFGKPFTVDSDRVSSLALGPDGRILAYGTIDGTIVLWDVSARRTLGEPLWTHKGSVDTVIFSQDGRLLVSYGQDREIRLWDLGLESWAARACRIADRNLTQEEWDLLIGSASVYRCTCPDLPPGNGAPLNACAQD